MNRPAVRAGLIGGVVVIVIVLLGLIPLCGCLSLPLEWLAFAGAGALAASYMPPPRQGGKAAGEGAIAGLIAGIMGGIVSMVLAPVSLAISGGSAQIINQLPPEALSAFRDAGIDPNTIFGTTGLLGVGAFCCIFGAVIALGLGALGGLIYASVKNQ